MDGRQPSMGDLLRTIISRQEEGGVKVDEQSEVSQEEKDMRAQIHAMELDGLTVVGKTAVAWGMRICPCSKMRHNGERD